MLRIIRNDSIENSAVFQENYHHELLLTQIVKMHVSANSDGVKDTIVLIQNDYAILKLKIPNFENFQNDYTILNLK